MKGFLSLVALGVLVGAVVSGWAVNEAFIKTPFAEATPIHIDVAEGETVATIARELAEQHLIGSERLFRGFVRLSGTGSAFRAGAFELKPGMSYASIVAVLTIPTSAKETELTIPEGYTRVQIGEAARKAFPEITLAQWDVASKDLEGYLFPDTYRFLVDATAEDIVKKMRSTFDRRVADAKITPTKDLVILASIVEREVRGADDMRQVADIFLKRLKIGMALQADSTVNYATGGKTPSVSYKDLKIDSPYNSYKYRGLPPGPISNPGIDALSAVANPSSNQFYYFLTTPTGEVKYARTYEEHLANRRFLR